MNKIMETNLEEIRKINSIYLSTLKSELNGMYLHFQSALQNQSSETLRDAMIYKKTLYTTMKRCEDAEKAFQLGVHYEKINTLISQYQERLKNNSIKSILSERVPKQLFDYLFEHGVSERDVIEDEFVLDIKPYMQKLIDVGLVYISITDDCEYYSLTAEGYTYKRTLEGEKQ